MVARLTQIERWPDIKGISLKLLQISFNSFQLVSSKFWKSVIFNLFEVSFLISNEINF